MIKRIHKNPIKRIVKKVENKIVNDKPKTIYHYDYEHDDGKKVSAEEKAYVEKLFIPHKIDNESLRIHPKGSRVLAEYKDTKGRKIHKYSSSEIYKNYLEKYKRNQLFTKNYESIISQIKKDINIKTKEGQAALILYIIYKTGLRVGSESDTKADQKAFGISTLLNKHVKLLPNNKIKLDFIGKKGVQNSTIISDSLIYDSLKKLKGKNWSNKIFDVSSSYVRGYLNSIDDRFNIKDFRTLKAYSIAKKEIEKRKGPATDEKTFAKWQKEVADIVADKLGNTRAVALNDYIDPSLWNKWRRKEWGNWTPKKLMVKDD